MPVRPADVPIVAEAFARAALAPIALRMRGMRAAGEVPCRAAREPLDRIRIERVATIGARACERLYGDRSCLLKALVVHTMLRRRGVPTQLVVGARKNDPRGLEAHARVTAGDAVLCGGGSREHYAVLWTSAEPAGTPGT